MLNRFVYILIAIFGLGTWTNLAGVWIELPIIVPLLPESWSLPAKLSLLISLANIIPITIVFASLIYKFNTAKFEVPVNFIILCTSILFSIGFAFLWNRTSYLFDTQQSIYLMCLCAFTAIADCTSSITFIPFLHRYEHIYLNAYFVGEALTALLPALLGIFQGIGKTDCQSIDSKINTTSFEYHHEPRFSVRTYFLILTALPSSALIAFTILRLMKAGRLKSAKQLKSTTEHHQSRVFILLDDLKETSVIKRTIQTIDNLENQLKINNDNESENKQSLTFENVLFLFIVFHTSAMLYGACPGLMTFSLNSYNSEVFHYTIIANQFAYPLMTLMGTVISKISSKVVYCLYWISTVSFGYIFITAKLSPCPPLNDHISGSILIFFMWVLIHLICSYIRIYMGNYFQKHLGHRGLIWFSVATQFGGLIGSFTIFLLIHNLKLFHERHICDTLSQCS